MKSQFLKRCFSTKTIASAADKAKYVPLSGAYPQGFQAGGIHAGVKKSGALDLTAIVSDRNCTAAAVFTKNAFKAAPVVLDQRILESSGGANMRALIINSGNANSVTGEGGYEDAVTMVETTDAAIGLSGDQMQSFVMSTGVIGNRLPIGKITAGIAELIKNDLGSSHKHWLTAAKGIMTTDTFPKIVSKEFTLDGFTYRIAGLAKGAGMINPNMATLLGLFVTDAPVAPEALQKALKFSVDRSFNSITVDGDCSTNDTIAALANGAAGGETITSEDHRYPALQEAITNFSEELAQLVVRDGEGATKFVTLKIEDALTYADAKKVGKSIANSPLVKTALYGRDANWGRIVCATGYAGVEVDPSNTSVVFVPSDGSEPLPVFVKGEPENVNEERATEILSQEDIEIVVSLGTGGGHSATIWTCDFSHEYITINGDYRS